MTTDVTFCECEEVGDDPDDAGVNVTSGSVEEDVSEEDEEGMEMAVGGVETTSVDAVEGADNVTEEMSSIGVVIVGECEDEGGELVDSVRLKVKVSGVESTDDVEEEERRKGVEGSSTATIFGFGVGEGLSAEGAPSPFTVVGV